jgi:hypothetical protein
MPKLEGQQHDALREPVLGRLATAAAATAVTAAVLAMLAALGGSTAAADATSWGSLHVGHRQQLAALHNVDMAYHHLLSLPLALYTIFGKLAASTCACCRVADLTGSVCAAACPLQRMSPPSPPTAPAGRVVAAVAACKQLQQQLWLQQQHTAQQQQLLLCVLLLCQAGAPAVLQRSRWLAVAAACRSSGWQLQPRAMLCCSSRVAAA